MPATMTRLQIRTKIRRKLGEPEGQEKNWTNVELNEDIQDTLDEIASMGTIRGSVAGEGDDGSEYDVPAEILQLFVVRVGDVDYLPCFVADYASLSAMEKLSLVLVNEDPAGDTVTFPAAVADGEEILFIGALHATQLDAADPADDTAEINLDNRFKPLIDRMVMFRAHEATEDNITVFEKSFKDDLARFGIGVKLKSKVLYKRAIRQVNDHCRY